MNPIALGAFLLGIGVLLGAFGAHGLKHLPAHALAWWQTATLYLFVHALGSLLIGVLARLGLCDTRPAWTLLAGVCFFCLSLYAMALGAPRALGAITPVGGALFVAGWLWLAWQARRLL